MPLLGEAQIKTMDILEHYIEDYVHWMISKGYTRQSLQGYLRVLTNFFMFICENEIAWDNIFTLETLAVFQKETGGKPGARLPAIRGLAHYLYQKNIINQPIPHIPPHNLPEVFEDYLSYCSKVQQVHEKQIGQRRRVLNAFNDYLERFDIKLRTITIEQIDAFDEEFNAGYSRQTRKLYKACLRGFLKYLHHDRNILRKDLAPLVVAPHAFSQEKPPYFLRPHEIQQLFAVLKLNTTSDLRTYAFVSLAYFMGLRPREICLITLDDISFKKKELRVKERKGGTPDILPIPPQTLKVIAAYLVGGRPDSKLRELFLCIQRPYRSISSFIVNHAVKVVMLRAGLPPKASAYWLRHTYAQNLLESGRSIYEIKEMMGHDSIESTRQYLRVHPNLMRRVLFDETI